MGGEAPAARVLAAAAATGSFVLLGLACATPVGVERVDARTVHRELTANALTADVPSPESIRVLYRRVLLEAWEDRPAATLATLHALQASGRGHRDDLFALAELSFLHAERENDPAHFLAAAVYAYAFLFPRDGAPPEMLDPRLRVAADLYNRGLTAGLAGTTPASVDLTPRSLTLPFGALELDADEDDFLWAGGRLDHFVAVADFEVRGLTRFRGRGIGAPLAADAVRLDPDASHPPEARWLPPRLKVPLTAFLRLRDVEDGLASGRVRGRLELYVWDAAEHIRVAGREVPLELEWTSSVAYALEQSRLWSLELRGFVSPEFRPYRDFEAGLYMLTPRRPGRIPVVFVHGTASSPARWGEMLNALVNDAVLRRHFEFWFFTYYTGAPIAYSAGLLREALQEAVTTLDPHARDAALRRMVVVGHSQGGLLAKLTVVESGDRFWSHISRVPPEELDIDPHSREILRRSLFVSPLSFVERVIFIATPHRGSFLAQWRLSSLAKRAARFPVRVARIVPDMAARNPEAVAERAFGRLPSSVDNMTPGHPFLVTLAELPLDEGVAGHSIIAVRGTGPPEQGDDGVVRFESAHVDGVASELVVRSTHSVQANPRAIAEVRRILHQHLEGS